MQQATARPGGWALLLMPWVAHKISQRPLVWGWDCWAGEGLCQERRLPALESRLFSWLSLTLLSRQEPGASPFNACVRAGMRSGCATGHGRGLVSTAAT